MTDKQAVIDALNRLPEGASLEEITEELHMMAAIRRGAYGHRRRAFQVPRKGRTTRCLVGDGMDFAVI